MRHVRPAHRVVGGLCALALAATLTACGSDGSGSTATEEPGGATTTATSQESTSATENATEEPSPIDDGAQIAVGQFVKRLQAGIAKTKQAHITFTMSGAGGEMKGAGDVDYTAQPPNMQVTMDMGPQALGMILVDGTMYIQSSQAGEKYLKFDLDDPNNPLGSKFSEQLDPAASMAAFADAVSSVTAAGEEEVDGRQLEKFLLSVDTTKLADQSQAGQLPAEMNVTVWLDDQDRMARSVMDMGAIKYDASLSDFDKELDLKAPPSDQITEPPAS